MLGKRPQSSLKGRRETGEATLRRAGLRTTKALRESERRYRSLFENMAEGFAYCRMLHPRGRPADFVYLAVNEAFAKLTGLGGVVGKRVSEAIPGIQESDPELFDIYDRVASTGKPERFERFINALDLWFSISVYSPKRGYFVAVFDVITERKRTEAELKLFRALIERTGDSIHVVDPTSARFLDVNESACHALGYTRKELLRMTVMDVTVGVDIAGFEAGHQLMRSKGNATIENVHRRKDGTTFPTEVSLSPVTLDREYVVAVVRDITERRRTEEALRNEQALFANLFNTIPDHIYFKDRQGRFIRINEAMVRAFGLRNAAEAVGKSDSDIFSEEHASQAWRDEQRIMETGEPMVGVEEKETWPDGHVTWVSSTKLPLRDPQGRVTGLIGVSRDITANRVLQSQFLQVQKMEAFGQLAGGVAHDFNNILAAMLMQLNLAEMEPGLSEASQSWLKELEHTAQRAAGLTRQMLLFSRREVMETRTVDLNQVIENVCKMLRRLLGEDILFELKQATEPMWIGADAGMLEQIVMNLCVNARDAMPQGGRLVIETGSEERAGSPDREGAPRGRYVYVAVTDTGAGMDEATRRRLFEPFFTTKPVGKGTGLGLATVYGIVKQHRGWVEVDSAPGRGSTFRVYFPYREPLPGADAPAGVPKARGGTERILVVEDDKTLRHSMASCLKSSGYDVVTAAYGAEALRLIGDRPPDFDLVITDIVMPGGLNGLQLAAKLKLAKPSLKVIAISGYYAGSEPESLPSDIFRMAKPFTADLLLERVRQRLDAE
jgi:two-component system cell cycle sensor histidine kinase/response regulator CckA